MAPSPLVVALHMYRIRCSPHLACLLMPNALQSPLAHVWLARHFDAHSACAVQVRTLWLVE